MIYAILIGLCAGALFFDFRKNLKESTKWEKALYLSLLFLALALLVLHEAGVKIPSPAPPIEKALKPLTGK